MNTKRGFLVLVAFGVALLVAGLARGDHDEDRHEHPVKPTDPAQALSPELRQLLVKEMQLIDNGMGELLSAISAGNWKSIEAIAGQIQHSFILKQQLTDQQLHELHDKLPDEFTRREVAVILEGFYTSPAAANS